MFSIFQLVGQPVEAFVESIPRGGTGRLKKGQRKGIDFFQNVCGLFRIYEIYQFPNSHSISCKRLKMDQVNFFYFSISNFEWGIATESMFGSLTEATLNQTEKIVTLCMHNIKFLKSTSKTGVLNEVLFALNSIKIQEKPRQNNYCLSIYEHLDFQK